MPKYHIVTDSGVRFSNHARVLQQYPLVVMPNRLDFAGKVYREDVDISTEDALKLVQSTSTPPNVLPPTPQEYLELYTRLAKTGEGILSIHPSRALSASWHNAQEAAQQATSPTCPIVAIDSRSFCAAQGMLVRYASDLMAEGVSFADLVNKVRNAIDRVYAIYCVETLDYLFRNQIVSESRAILGTLLGVRPILGLEDGKLTVIEKVRTRTQLIEHFVEFVSEFIQLEDVLILQPRASITEQTRLIQDRLSLAFPSRHFAFTTYSATTASYLGADAMGVVVFESEETDD